MFTQKDFSCRPVGEKPPPHKFPQIVKKSNKKILREKKNKKLLLDVKIRHLNL